MAHKLQDNKTSMSHGVPVYSTAYATGTDLCRSLTEAKMCVNDLSEVALA